jgi:hypothetical protein
MSVSRSRGVSRSCSTLYLDVSVFCCFTNHMSIVCFILEGECLSYDARDNVSDFIVVDVDVCRRKRLVEC